jgi:hypothetical protein
MTNLWITYAWADDDEGDFSYLVQELEKSAVTARYDKIALVPGRHLWDQIATEITGGELDGWAYLITPASLESEACREELAYALDRALRSRGNAFPLIGLVHRVRFEDVPPALRVRLAVSLANPNWREEVRAGLEGRSPESPKAPVLPYIVDIHDRYGGDSTLVTVEIRPRFEELMYWRVVVPRSAEVVNWGHGPAGGGPISGVSTMRVEGGEGTIGSTSIKWFGAGDRISSGISTFVVFRHPLPERIWFGRAAQQCGEPREMIEINLRPQGA